LQATKDQIGLSSAGGRRQRRKDDQITTRASHNTRRLAALAASVAALLVTLLIATTTAHAENNNWSGRMPAKTWSTNGDFHPYLHFMYIEATGSSCMGPAQISGGKWIFPYGWNCQTSAAWHWEFPQIGAYPAVDNPNSQPFNFSLFYI
jgi:hypothetical protein